jgi:hypothetical protein
VVVGLRGPLRNSGSVNAVSWARFKQFFKLARIGVWFGFAFALAGSFEQALEASSSPVWSSVFGFPMLHHYLIGFIVLAVSLLILELKKR